MSTFADRLAKAMAKNNFNQSDLARRAGIKPQAIQYLLDPKNNARGSKYTTSIALACDVSGIWLANGTGGMDLERQIATKLHQNIEHGPEIRGEIPVISWVQAGQWNFAEAPIDPREAEDWYACPVKHSTNTYALRVRGDSMTAMHGRSYPDGTIIFVDPERRTPSNGDRIIAKLEHSSEVTFKLFAEDAGRVFLRPINSAYPPILEPFKVLGTVIGAWID